MNKKVLLIEPNYSNKFPPVGLMKISTYYKTIGGWDVTFFKGDLKKFVIDRIADRCVEELDYIDDTIDWFLRKEEIKLYIKTRRKEYLEAINTKDSDLDIIITSKIVEAKNYYWNDEWKKNPEWDRVAVTTLFTFYWDITIDTINFAKFLVKREEDLNIGGVLASIQTEELRKAVGNKVSITKGILSTPGEFDKGNNLIIDNLPLDYSILDEIEYKYPMSNAFYGYITRGCVRRCPFCAVPILDPIYNPYIPLKDRIEQVREIYGDQKDLLLMDNNVLASKHFSKIIDDIVCSGFGKGSTYTQPNMLDVSIRNLREGRNDRAYIRKSQELIMAFYSKLKGEVSFQVYRIIDRYHINKLSTTKKENLIAAYDELKPIHDKYFHPIARQRYVDFNQGVDARLLTKEKADLLAKIAIKPLRIAFDDIETFPQYNQALRWCVEAGITDFSNYLLYNYEDEPVDLYNRLKINVELCDELGVNIYSFPMKYHPLTKGTNDDEDYSHNRDYIGRHWNRKYIRAIQAILNSTKGKVGRGKEFFMEAFGKTEDEYFELLEMPETFILYRFFFKWLDSKGLQGTDHWRKTWNLCKSSLNDYEWKEVLEIIHINNFTETEINKVENPLSKGLLGYYVNFRKDIITEGNELYKLKQEFDALPKEKN